MNLAGGLRFPRPVPNVLQPAYTGTPTLLWSRISLLARIQRLEDSLNEALVRVVHLEDSVATSARRSLEREAEHADRMQQLDTLFRRMSTRWQRHEQALGGDSIDAEPGDNLALMKRLNDRRR